MTQNNVSLTRVSDQMAQFNHDDLAIIVPTRNREGSLHRLLASQQNQARGIPVHAVRHPTDGYDYPYVTMWESDAFPLGKLYRSVVKRIQADAFLFLDDDHSLTPAFSVQKLREALEEYPVWSLPIRDGDEERTIRDAAKCGGQLVSLPAYKAAGGHGDDYLEDIELSLRLSWAGYPPKRYSEKLTVHHTGADGGMRSNPDIRDKADAYEQHSRLAERYEQVKEDSNSYYGYREMQ